MEAAQQAASGAPAAEETEVTSIHDDGVEGVTEALVDPLERDGAGVADPAPARHFHRERRDVDREDIEAPFLQVKRHPPGTATDVEDAASGEPKRAPLVRRPAAVWLEVAHRAAVRGDEAVIALDDLGRGLAFQVIEEKPAVGVFSLLHAPNPIAATLLGRPAGAGADTAPSPPSGRSSQEESRDGDEGRLGPPRRTGAPRPG